ncbi:MAG: VTC domain-containing protein [Planctomycetota bacterium]
MAAATLELHDEALLRRDLAERGEAKFLFPRHDVATVRATLRRAATPVCYAGPSSVVRSVYFDDHALGACHANLAGLGVRSKFRVRWYDAAAPADDAWFEVKWRRSLATGKHRLRIPGAGALFGKPLGEWPHLLRRAAPERLAAALGRMEQAVLVVQYRREHFLLGDARLTLDYDLQFYPLLGRRRLALRFPSRSPATVLVECKAPLGAAGREPGVLRPLGARAVRFSKYVAGCQRLGYVADL